MMRKNLLGLLACFVCMVGGLAPVIGQERCGSMPLIENTFKRNASLKSKFQIQTQLVGEAALKRKLQAQTLRVEGATLYIPVVFHVVLRNTLLVTDAQIQAQIDRLNLDYGGVNPDTTLIPAW